MLQERFAFLLLTGDRRFPVMPKGRSLASLTAGSLAVQ